MALADAVGPAGLGCLVVGMAISGAGESGWLCVGLALMAFGGLLLFLSY